MQELLDRLLAALALAGIRAQEALPAKMVPQLKGPMTAVGISKVGHGPAGLGGYLGTREDIQTGARAVYGAMMDAEVFFKIASPVHLGGGRCFREAMAVLDVLLGGIGGMEILGCRMDRCQYDARTDQFTSTVAADLRAAVYLERTEAGEESFADFQLKGEVQ